MNRLQALTGVAAIAALSACAPALAHTAAARGTGTGTVAGKLHVEGGPIGPSGQQPGKRPVPGTVQFTGIRQRRVTVPVGNSGSFSVRLAPGSYAACSRPAGAQGPCFLRRRVTVTAGQTTKIAFTFFVP